MWEKGETERFPVDSESGLFKDLKKRERGKKGTTYFNLIFRYSFYAWPNSFRRKALERRRHEK